MNQSTEGHETIWRPSENVVTRTIADEMILVPISGNLANMQRIFTVNEMGSFIWALLDGKRSVKSIHEAMMEEFDVGEEQAAGDLSEFIGHLRQAGLIMERSV
jgi:methyltransferase-like protein